MDEDALAKWRAHDAESNTRSSPPDDEHLDMSCVWCVELFTPSQTAQLIDACNRIWPPGQESASMKNPVQWLEDRRHRGPGWSNFGFLVPETSDISLVGYWTKAQLPPMFDYAHVQAYSVSASLIALVFGFVVKEDWSREIDILLSESRQTNLVPKSPNSYSILNPDIQKREDIHLFRKYMVNCARDWVYSNCPGHFASDKIDGDLPTSELTSTRVDMPFAANFGRGDKVSGYLWLAGLDKGNDVWVSDTDSTVYFARYSSVRQHSIFACHESGFDRSNDKDTPVHREVRIDRANEVVPPLLAADAMNLVIKDYATQIRYARDTLLDSDYRSRASYGVLRDADQLLSDTIEMAELCYEIRDQSRNALWILHAAPGMSSLSRKSDDMEKNSCLNGFPKTF